ncbi:MAG: thioredoxin [Gammaproteobacteria bacterium]
MADSPYVFDVTEADYPRSVLDNSRRVPVLVDFWADWCGPCKMQLPVLLKLAGEYAGKFLLAKVNTDTERGLASLHNIRSIPTLKLFRDGQVVEEILGAQTESTLRTLLDKHVPRASDALREQALALAAAGDLDAALNQLRVAAADDPDNPRAQLDYLRLAMQAGQLDEADRALAGLPRELRDDAEIRRLAVLLDLARRSASAPERAALEQRLAQNPDDLAARELLAAKLAVAGETEAALEQYLDILRRDRRYGDEAGRKGLLALFELLGSQHPLVGRYRAQLFTLLH